VPTPGALGGEGESQPARDFAVPFQAKLRSDQAIVRLHAVSRLPSRVGVAVEVEDREVVVAGVKSEPLIEIQVTYAKTPAKAGIGAEPPAVIEFGAAQGGPQTGADDIVLQPHAGVPFEAERGIDERGIEL